METLLYIVIGLLVLAIILLAVVLLRKNYNEEMARQLLLYRQETEANQQRLQGEQRQLLEVLKGEQRQLLEFLQGEQLRLRESVAGDQQRLAELLKSDQQRLMELLQGDKSQLMNLLQGNQQSFKQEVLQQLQVMNSSSGEAVERLSKSAMGTMSSLNGQLSQAMDQRLSAMESRLRTLEKTNEERMGKLQSSNESKLEHMRTVLEQGMSKLQAENDKKLEDIRITVGEKLQSTLEERLALSFKSVNDNLKHVFESVGEMKELANEVGSLKNVLGNVKLRGNFGETQLAAILEEILAPDQYDTNVVTIPGSKERVEFAVKMPGGENGFIYLPIDAKFPADLYNHLQEAKQAGDKAAIQECYKALHNKVLADAKDINSKYIKSPHTTDFGIMFLPFEGLYSEVLTLPGIIEELQKKQHIIIAGPSNMVAMLNSLRMGFRTLALQKRTAEVWSTLEAVKTEFGKFGECMDKMRSHLDQTSQDLDHLMGTRSRKINKALNKVEAMELEKAESLLQIEAKQDE